MAPEDALPPIMRSSNLTRWLAAVVLCTRCAACLIAAPPGLEINRVEPVSAWPMLEPPTYDSAMTVERLEDGTLWAAWQAYAGGREAILARRVRDTRQGRFVLVTPQEGIHGHPHVVALGAKEAWVVWMTCDRGRWRVIARRIVDDVAGDAVEVSTPGIDAVLPGAVRSGAAGLRVAWQALVDGRMTVQTRHFDGGRWHEPVTLSVPGGDAFRPVLVSDERGGETWALWDEYQDNNYRVLARRIAPAMGGVEPVSPGTTYGVKPDGMISHRGELWATWVRAWDVTGGDAAIDQSNAAVVAVRRDGRWRMVPEAGGREEIVSLDQGLLARMAPQPVPTGGYLGERRRPMLLEHDGAVWVACERKSDETGRTPDVVGELVGREYRDGRWSELRRLHRGGLDYRPAHRATVNGAWLFAASRLPRETRRIYECVSVTPGSAPVAKDDRVAGWTPVTLPLRPRAETRESIIEAGRTLRLYWIDSHVHSALTLDAEGEPDEILHYARDRALLDAVVMQENDHVYDVPLTETEYALGTWLARWITGRGRILALPGYEWTQILPLGGADPARPRFWRDSEGNHRTVIYPLAGGPLLRYTDAANDIRRLYDVVRAAGGVMHTQHPTFTPGHEPGEVAIEVTTGWGIYFLNPGRIHRALNAGYRKAFVGTSDSHRRNPGLGGGLTGLYAADLTDTGILEAYRERRVYATAGARVAVEARLNGVLMGRDVPVTDRATLTLRASGPRPIRRAVLVRDGVDVKHFPGDERLAIDLRHEEPIAPGRTSWFYWRLELAGPGSNYRGNVATAEGNLAWSSPLWAVSAP